MSLMNDVLRDLEARDASAPAKSVRVMQPKRSRGWLIPVVAGVGLLAVTSAMGMWLLERHGNGADSRPDANNSLAMTQTPQLTAATPHSEETSTESIAISPRSNPQTTTAESADREEPKSAGASSLQVASHQSTTTTPANDAAPHHESGLDQAMTPDIASGDPQSNTVAFVPSIDTSKQPGIEPSADSAPLTRRARTEQATPRPSSSPAVSPSPNIVVQRAGAGQNDESDALDSARRALSRGQAGVAISRLEKLLADNPAQFEARILLARTLLASGRSPRAEVLLAEGVQQYPNAHELRFWLARVQLGQNRPTVALNTLQTQLPPVEEALDYHLLHAATLHQLERHADALASYETITATFPGNARAWLGQALSAEALGLTDTALAAFRSTLQHGDARTAALARQRIAALERARTATE